MTKPTKIFISDDKKNLILDYVYDTDEYREVISIKDLISFYNEHYKGTYVYNANYTDIRIEHNYIILSYQEKLDKWFYLDFESQTSAINKYLKVNDIPKLNHYGFVVNKEKVAELKKEKLTPIKVSLSDDKKDFIFEYQESIADVRINVADVLSAWGTNWMLNAQREYTEVEYDNVDIKGTNILYYKNNKKTHSLSANLKDKGAFILKCLDKINNDKGVSIVYPSNDINNSLIEFTHFGKKYSYPLKDYVKSNIKERNLDIVMSDFSIEKVVIKNDKICTTISATNSLFLGTIMSADMSTNKRDIIEFFRQKENKSKEEVKMEEIKKTPVELSQNGTFILYKANTFITADYINAYMHYNYLNSSDIRDGKILVTIDHKDNCLDIRKADTYKPWVCGVSIDEKFLEQFARNKQIHLEPAEENIVQGPNELEEMEKMAAANTIANPPEVNEQLSLNFVVNAADKNAKTDVVIGGPTKDEDQKTILISNFKYTFSNIKNCIFRTNKTTNLIEAITYEDLWKYLGSIIDPTYKNMMRCRIRDNKIIGSHAPEYKDEILCDCSVIDEIIDLKRVSELKTLTNPNANLEEVNNQLFLKYPYISDNYLIRTAENSYKEFMLDKKMNDCFIYYIDQDSKFVRNNIKCNAPNYVSIDSFFDAYCKRFNFATNITPSMWHISEGKLSVNLAGVKTLLNANWHLAIDDILDADKLKEDVKKQKYDQPKNEGKKQLVKLVDWANVKAAPEKTHKYYVDEKLGHFTKVNNKSGLIEAITFEWFWDCYDKKFPNQRKMPDSYAINGNTIFACYHSAINYDPAKHVLSEDFSMIDEFIDARNKYEETLKKVMNFEFCKVDLSNKTYSIDTLNRKFIVYDKINRTTISVKFEEFIDCLSEKGYKTPDSKFFTYRFVGETIFYYYVSYDKNNKTFESKSINTVHASFIDETVAFVKNKEEKASQLKDDVVKAMENHVGQLEELQFRISKIQEAHKKELEEKDKKYANLQENYDIFKNAASFEMSQDKSTIDSLSKTIEDAKSERKKEFDQYNKDNKEIINGYLGQLHLASDINKEKTEEIKELKAKYEKASKELNEADNTILTQLTLLGELSEQNKKLEKDNRAYKVQNSFLKGEMRHSSLMNYRLIDIEKENVKKIKDLNEKHLPTMIKSDAIKAAYRIGATQSIKALRHSIITALKAVGKDNQTIKVITELLDSDIGVAMLTSICGYALSYSNLDNEVIENLTKELRVQGIEIAGNKLFEQLFETIISSINISKLQDPIDKNDIMVISESEFTIRNQQELEDIICNHKNPEENKTIVC